MCLSVDLSIDVVYVSVCLSVCLSVCVLVFYVHFVCRVSLVEKGAPHSVGLLECAKVRSCVCSH